MSNYNDLLFSGGWRSRLHRMRFEWLKRQVQEPPESFTVFELGCFDCRSLNYLPKPKHYLGADAGWEGGINDAQMTFVNKPWIELVVVQSALDLRPYADRRFDYSIALETLEHIPDGLLDGYLKFLATVTAKRLLITVPVEVGPVFLLKYLGKRTFSHLHNGETDTYTMREVFWATVGRAEHVRRYEHKGFDYRVLLETLARYFTIDRVEGLPFRESPWLSFQVGIIASPRHT